MAVLPIIIAPDPRLKLVSEPVDAVDDEVRRLMDDMLESMYAARGIGLAAPQVGVTKRVIVLDLAHHEAAPRPAPHGQSGDRPPPVTDLVTFQGGLPLPSRTLGRRDKNPIGDRALSGPRKRGPQPRRRWHVGDLHPARNGPSGGNSLRLTTSRPSSAISSCASWSRPRSSKRRRLRSAPCRNPCPHESVLWSSTSSPGWRPGRDPMTT